MLTPLRSHRQKVLLLAEGADEGGVVPDVLLGAVHGAVEIHLHLEQLHEVRVVGVQRVVEHRIANENGLDVEGYRLRSQALGGHKAHPVRRLLNGDAAVFEAPFESLPCQGVAQHLLYPDDIIAPVGAMQGAGAYHGEVCLQGAELGLSLHSSHDVVRSRAELRHYGRLPQVRVVDNDVHLVSTQAVLGVRRWLQWAGRLTLLLGLCPEQVDVLRHVLLNFLQEGDDLWKCGVLFLNLHCQEVHGVSHYVLVHLMDAFVQAPLDGAHVGDDLFQVGFQLLPALPYIGSLIRREGRHLIFGQWSAFALRNQSQAGRGGLENKAILSGSLVELLE